MKPKHLLRFAIISFTLAVSIFIWETKRKATLTCIIEKCSNKVEIKPTNNDFIFVESVSKLLFVAFSK